jgi:NAD(P)-dependent dehydrogenase (short-subunit alcohol dehydrogenase family)
MELNGKVVLITGGTRGIGAAAAKEFAQRGADLALVGRYRDAEAEETLAQVGATGRRVLFIAGDMSLPEDATRCVQTTVETFGGLDVLVHSAGGPALGSLMDVSPEVWHHTFDVHVHAIFYLCRAAVPHLKQRGEGAVVLISSAAGLRGVLNAAAYAVVKGAVIQLTRTLARELADDNIRVNCVAPGVIRTRFQDYLTPEQVENNLKNRIPLHREGTTEEVAQVIALLAENNFMTGETVTIDGGITMRIA